MGFWRGVRGREREREGGRLGFVGVGLMGNESCCSLDCGAHVWEMGDGRWEANVSCLFAGP